VFEKSFEWRQAGFVRRHKQDSCLSPVHTSRKTIRQEPRIDSGIWSRSPTPRRHGRFAGLRHSRGFWAAALAGAGA